MRIYVVSEGAAKPSIGTVGSAESPVDGPASDDREAAVIVIGALAGVSLHVFAAAIESALNGSDRVRIDLSRTTRWSLVSQAMVLNVNQRLLRRGGRVVIHAPSQGLREAPDRFGIFSRIELSPDPAVASNGFPAPRRHRTDPATPPGAEV